MVASRVVNIGSMGPAVFSETTRTIGATIVIVAVPLIVVVAIIIVAISIPVAVVTVAVAVVVALLITVAVAIVVASRTGIITVAVVAVVLIPHHRRHHALHLGPHSGLSRLKICFATLQTVGNISEIFSGNGLDTWSRLNRWRSFGLFVVETLEDKIGNGCQIGVVRRLLVVYVGSSWQ